MTNEFLFSIISKVNKKEEKIKMKNGMKKNLIKIFAALTAACALALALVACPSDNTPGGVKLIDVKLTDEEYAFVCKKGNTELTESLNAFLQESKANGSFDALVAKYFEGVGEKVGYDVTTSDVKNDETNLVVVTNCPFEPFEYIGDDGKIYGLDIELAAAYAESAGLTLVVKNIGFDDIFSQIDAGYADVGMAGITVSEDRAELYDFTNTYYKASQKLIVAADNTDFDDCTTAEQVEKKLSELSGVNIGYQIGTTGGMYVNGDEDFGFSGFPNITGKGYSTAQEAITDLVNGNLYAVIVDEAPANALVKAVND